MTSTGFNPRPEWYWPQNTHLPPRPRASQDSSSMPGAFYEDPTSSPKPDQPRRPRSTTSPEPKRKYWPPRTCRICLETVEPTFYPPSDSVPEMFQSSPSATYESPDPEAGRLLRPCKCKGSSKYVHEGCLQAWRHADPDYGKRNYWQCPTCGFRYRLERMQWGRWISSTATQITLTCFIFFMAMFVMGFVADPIINLYVDPYSFISSAPFSKVGARVDPMLTDDDIASWTEHFIKGLASLGLLGFVKVLFALSPWQWWNIRTSGIMNAGGRSGNTGRDRLASISWVVVVIGIATFLWVHVSPSNCCVARLTLFLGCLQRRPCMESSNSRKSRGKSHGCCSGRRRRRAFRSERSRSQRLKSGFGSREQDPLK